MTKRILIVAAVALIVAMPLSACTDGHSTGGRAPNPTQSTESSSTTVAAACAQLRAPAVRTAYQNHRIDQTQTVAVLALPKLAANVVIVEGVTEPALRAGAGHYPTTPLPGDPGNVAVAMQHLPNSSPDAALRAAMPGDQIVISTPIAAYGYTIVAPFAGHPNPWTVDAGDLSVVAQPRSEPAPHWLTITAPLTTDAHQRLVLRANFTHVTRGPCDED